MSNAYQNLIDFWRSCPLEKPPYIAPQDRPYINEKYLKVFLSYNSYIENNIFGDNQDTSLHVGLLPVPFIGDLQKATVFILMLNPGLGSTDYFGEYQNDKFRQTHLQNLRQNNKTNYPFHFLNPEFSWHGGFEYWHAKFGGITRHISKVKNISYRDSLQFLSEQVACLELIPYHSRIFGANSLINKLPSAKVMQAYVKDFLLEKATKGDITIIVTRSAKNWNLPEEKNVIIYGNNEARSAHLTLNSSGGKAIAAQLGI